MVPYGSHVQGMQVRYLPLPFGLQPAGSEPLPSIVSPCTDCEFQYELQIVDHAVALYIDSRRRNPISKVPYEPHNPDFGSGTDRPRPVP